MNFQDLRNNFSNEEIENIKQEMISLVNKEEVEQLFKVTLKYSYDSNETNTDKLDPRAVDKFLSVWADHKWPIFILLGRKLCHSFQTGIDIDNNFGEELKQLFEKENIRRGRKKGYEGDIISTRHFVLYKVIVDLFSQSELIENICKDKAVYGNILLGYKNGQKLSRFFSKFFNDENFDIEYSKLFQNKVDGLIGNISIDPIDILTCSISTNFGFSCYSLFEFYNAAPYDLMLGKNDVILFCTKGLEKITKVNYKISFPIRNKINRSFLYLPDDLKTLHFHSHIVDSCKKFVPKYVEEISRLMKENLQEDIKFHEDGRCKIKYCLNFHHCCDVPREYYTSSKEIIKPTINPGNSEVWKLSDVDKHISVREGLFAWME